VDAAQEFSGKSKKTNVDWQEKAVCIRFFIVKVHKILDINLCKTENSFFSTKTN